MVQLRGDRGRSDRLWHFLVAFRQLLKLGRFEIMRRHWGNDVRLVNDNCLIIGVPSISHDGFISMTCRKYDLDVITNS